MLAGSTSVPLYSRGRRAAWLSVVAALLLPRPAAAGDPKVEVIVTPQGQPWSIGAYGGWECEPTCTVYVPPEKHLVTIGSVTHDLLIRGPTVINYAPGSPRLRTAAGWTAIGGFVVGGVLGGVGLYSVFKSCVNSQGCPEFNLSRTAQQVIITTAGVLISMSVAAAIVFAVSGDAISIRQEDPPSSPLRKSFDVMLNPSSQGATLDFMMRF